MTELTCYKQGRFKILLDQGDLSPAPSEIISLLQKPLKREKRLLGGRTSVGIGYIAPWGDVVVKRYARGGVFGRFISEHYLRWGDTRSVIEYSFLRKVREIGVNAPLPKACIEVGSLVYRTWLVTELIPDTESLAEISRVNEERASRLIIELIRQVAILIRHGILHIDLHPGNVLVDKQDKVYLIDFDRAVKLDRDYNDIRDRYIFRWRRAVIKHSLPDILSEILCHGLRTSHA